MIKYLVKVHQLSSRFTSFEVIRVPRTENAKADVLSKLAASGYTTLGSIHMEFLQRSSIDSKGMEVMQVEDEPCWMDEIVSYLRDARLPEDKKEARKVIQRAARFSLSGDDLYKRSYTLPYLKCLRPSDAAKHLLMISAATRLSPRAVSSFRTAQLGRKTFSLGPVGGRAPEPVPVEAPPDLEEPPP
ncbi:uncharacterized protein LOC143888970 [Tasmannia lanceolata]|uniref:uncharacterized protein LOC143888970 n=1 Tax=Tasmannia lanceolata TaxID=3420 RepID=UPI004062E7E6